MDLCTKLLVTVVGGFLAFVLVDKCLYVIVKVFAGLGASDLFVL